MPLLSASWIGGIVHPLQELATPISSHGTDYDLVPPHMSQHSYRLPSTMVNQDQMMCLLHMHIRIGIRPCSWDVGRRKLYGWEDSCAVTYLKNATAISSTPCNFNWASPQALHARASSFGYEGMLTAHASSRRDEMMHMVGYIRCNGGS